VFIDTIIICTMTALVILTVSGDFKRSPALILATACADQELAQLPVKSGETLWTVAEVFPSVSTPGREALVAERGAMATKFLNDCRAAGMSMTPLLADKTPEAEAAYFAQALAAASDPAVLKDVRYVWQTDSESSGITARAFGTAIPGGEWIVTVALFFFAFTTIIGWSYYGEQAATYMLGEWATHPFRYLWVLVVFGGAMVTNTNALWLLGDIANASMAFPNLLALLLLSGVVVAMHKGKT
jgi:AGCS family alanine or glycine:cation symporter